MQGCIYRNGISYTEKAGNFKSDSCYIMQDDFLNPLITVSEYMQLAADLKLGNCHSEKAKKILVRIKFINEGQESI